MLKQYTTKWAKNMIHHYWGSDGKYLGDGIRDNDCEKIFGLK